MNSLFCSRFQSVGRSAFTLLELLVSMTLLGLILMVLGGFTGMVSRSYRATMADLDSFESARTALDHLSRTLSRATLMPYMGYDDPKAPSSYSLKSDLHFFSGPQSALGFSQTSMTRTHAIFFQATLGGSDSPTDSVLASTGFFLAYGGDPLLPPPFAGKVENRRRCRLFQYVPPRDHLKVYEHTLALRLPEGVLVSDQAFAGPDWFLANADRGRFCHPIAENVVFLGILPVFGGASPTSYRWNSRDGTVPATHHRLPHSVKIALAVVDDASARQLESTGQSLTIIPEELFELNDAEKFDEHIGRLNDALALVRPSIKYRVFTADIRLGASNSSL